MADSDYGKELASLDFKNLIGGPLSAVVEAQAMAAESTVNFIKNMGFDQEGNPQYVTFKYQKSATQAEGEAKQSDQNEMMEMQVPFLTLIPIPFIRVDEATIDFNAKINAINYSNKTSDHKFDAGSDRRKGFIGRLLGIKASYSYKSTTNSGNRVERTFTLAIHVRAVQDEMPGGMEKILGILESSIRDNMVTRQAAGVEKK
jgi:uncharacterized protein AF_0417